MSGICKELSLDTASVGHLNAKPHLWMKTNCMSETMGAEARGSQVRTTKSNAWWSMTPMPQKGEVGSPYLVHIDMLQMCSKRTSEEASLQKVICAFWERHDKI